MSKENEWMITEWVCESVTERLVTQEVSEGWMPNGWKNE